MKLIHEIGHQTNCVVDCVFNTGFYFTESGPQTYICTSSLIWGHSKKKSNIHLKFLCHFKADLSPDVDSELTLFFRVGSKTCAKLSVSILDVLAHTKSGEELLTSGSDNSIGHNYY